MESGRVRPQESLPPATCARRNGEALPFGGAVRTFVLAAAPRIWLDRKAQGLPDDKRNRSDVEHDEAADEHDDEGKRHNREAQHWSSEKDEAKVALEQRDTNVDRDAAEVDRDRARLERKREKTSEPESD